MITPAKPPHGQKELYPDYTQPMASNRTQLTSAVKDTSADEKSALASRPHICVCVCTFKRPALLADLLTGLLSQKTDALFSFSVVVVDNDSRESGRETVERFQCNHPGIIQYFIEPTQNIALARNRGVAHATGNLVAFIDDDEVPPEGWLLSLYGALIKFKADGVLGPVKPRYDVAPSEWALKAGIFDRPNSQDYQTGLVLHWGQTGTGNVLMQRSALELIDGPFRREFGSGGEDIDFFRRLMDQGNVFVWCAEAVAYETVPAERTQIYFQLKRALLRGKASLRTPSGNPFGILKSLAACVVYTLFLPFSLVVGRHVFLKYLVKNCDHLGKLLAFFRINLVREKYVMK